MINHQGQQGHQDFISLPASLRSQRPVVGNEGNIIGDNLQNVIPNLIGNPDR